MMANALPWGHRQGAGGGGMFLFLTQTGERSLPGSGLDEDALVKTHE